MKPAHVLVAVIFGGLLPVGGQSLPPQKAPEIQRTSTDTNLLRWHGHQGRSYFLQVSDPSKHLEKWLWMPVIIAGADAEISQEVQSIGNKGFYRICYTDQVPGAGETLETADFDQDGLSNMSEIRPQNGIATHPLNPDTDADGLKDGWEVSHAFNPHDSSDAAGDKDGDGLTNLQEYQWGANPANPDTDGDGAMDGDEKDGNTNLKDPESAPQEGWIVLTGDYPKEERKALKRAVTIPKGQTRVVVVVLHSEEYPEYTEYNSEFDDLLEWKITPTGGTEIAGQAGVNDKHADWQLAESKGTAIKNFYPAHIEKVSSLTAPPEKDLTVTLELAATNISDDEKPSTVMVGLLPVEVAPDKLASNGDFNEGDTGATSAQTTGAKADNRNQTLIAARDSTDGSVNAGDLVTEDLHEGWFGLLPDAMPDGFFDGATITITKLHKTDPATGEREEGTVRFFATWGENQETVIDYNDPFIDSMFLNGSAPKNMVGKVYGANKTIPSGAKFWIEGVSLGKITLEWRYQKGDTDIKYEQTFEIGNDWPKEKWHKAVRDEIYLDSYTSSSGSAMNGSSTQGVDTDQYAVANDFLPNRPYIYSVYEYYAKLHRDEPGKFLWAGLAKQAGAPVYAGLSDAQNGRTGIAIATFGIIDNQTLRTIQDILIDANINIYNDLAYQFVAYRTGGIDSIEYLAQIQNLSPEALIAWQKIDEGNDVSGGNQGLLEREQSIILKQTYIDLDDLADGKVSWLFSLLAENPVPGGPDFQAVVPSGNISVFNDRWQWITNTGNGMWPLWMGKSETQRLQFSNRVLTSYADTFNLVAPLR